jgi:hypothetical protein
MISILPDTYALDSSFVSLSSQHIIILVMVHHTSPYLLVRPGLEGHGIEAYRTGIHHPCTPRRNPVRLEHTLRPPSYSSLSDSSPTH